jgi:capsular exopolysaccharide synthesis family protein
VGVGAAAVWTILQTPIYESRSRVLVSTSGDVVFVAAPQVAAFAGQRPVVDAAVEASGVPRAPAGVTAQSSEAQPFVDIAVRDSDPVLAQQVNGALPEVLPAVLADLDQIGSPSEVNLQVLDGPSLPGSPVSPQPSVNLVVGLVVGLLVGLLVAVARELLDQRLVESHEIEASTHLPVLGVVPEELTKESLVARTSPQSLRAEAYRKIRTNLLFATPGGLPSSLVVTSASPGEGKSSVAMNLALVCAAAGDKVVLVDGDLRRPVVSREFRVTSDPGLGALLRGSAHLSQVLRATDVPDLMLIPAGRPVEQPSELLQPDLLRELLSALAEEADIVIIDAPPLIPVADPVQLASACRGVILVTRLGTTTEQAISKAIRAVERTGVPVLGLVPNGASGVVDRAYGYGDYYYRSSQSAAPDEAAAGRRRRSRSSAG